MTEETGSTPNAGTPGTSAARSADQSFSAAAATPGGAAAADCNYGSDGGESTDTEILLGESGLATYGNRARRMRRSGGGGGGGGGKRATAAAAAPATAASASSAPLPAFFSAGGGQSRGDDSGSDCSSFAGEGGSENSSVDTVDAILLKYGVRVGALRARAASFRAASVGGAGTGGGAGGSGGHQLQSVAVAELRRSAGDALPVPRPLPPQQQQQQQQQHSHSVRRDEEALNFTAPSPPIFDGLAEVALPGGEEEEEELGEEVMGCFAAVVACTPERRSFAGAAHSEPAANPVATSSPESSWQECVGEEDEVPRPPLRLAPTPRTLLPAAATKPLLSHQRLGLFEPSPRHLFTGASAFDSSPPPSIGKARVTGQAGSSAAPAPALATNTPTRHAHALSVTPLSATRSFEAWKAAISAALAGPGGEGGGAGAPAAAGTSSLLGALLASSSSSGRVSGTSAAPPHTLPPTAALSAENGRSCGSNPSSAGGAFFRLSFDLSEPRAHSFQPPPQQQQLHLQQPPQGQRPSSPQLEADAFSFTNFHSVWGSGGGQQGSRGVRGEAEEEPSMFAYVPRSASPPPSPLLWLPAALDGHWAQVPPPFRAHSEPARCCEACRNPRVCGWVCGALLAAASARKPAAPQPCKSLCASAARGMTRACAPLS